MRLKKLELYGFKSFAQRTEIVFNEGITGIVGPNGSGKSNIADAVRWVLGEQSAKTLRGASMQDVIFNGTQKRRPLSYCEVSLVFENEDRALPVDYSEVMVTRRVYRSGESEYFLNRSACRLKDVIDLFRDTGIGKEGYSIIGQGRIDEILSRKGEDRRQVFEEAAGIVKFKARKEEADRKLARTRDNMIRVDDILEEMERRLEPLEEQSKNARAYLELAAELKNLDLNLFLVRSDRMETRIQETDRDLHAIHAVLDQTEMTLQQKTERRDARQAEIAELDQQVADAHAGLMSGMESVHQAENALRDAEERQRGREETRIRIAGELREAAERMAELERLQSETGHGEQAGSEALAEREKALAEAQAEEEKAQRDEAEKEQALENQKAAMIEAMNRQAAARNDQTRLRTMLANMESRLEEVTGSCADMRKQESRLEEQVSEARSRLKEENDRQALLESSLQQVREALDSADARVILARQSYDQQLHDMRDMESRQKLLSEMSAEMEGYSHSVRSVMKYARDRGLTSVKGAVSQLISVPEEYETAMDMALGAAQQHIVTDQEETAQRLIEYLRSQHLGRATFLPVSAIRPKTLTERERQVLTMPGCLGVASELVSCAPEYRAVVENLLGRTVVADDLTHGIAIMRRGNHAFRLVTLQGDVMHSGGSMTGGSVSSRAVNLFTRERELRELTEKLRTGQAELEKLLRAMQEGQREKDERKQESADALEALHQQEIAVARETEHVRNAEEELQTHSMRLRETEAAREQLMESMLQIRDQLSQVSGSAEEQSETREEMTRLADAMQAELTAARERTETAKQETLQRTLEVNDLRHELETLLRDSARYEQEKERANREQQRRQEVLDELGRTEETERQRTEELRTALAETQAEQGRREKVAESLEADRSRRQDDLRQLLAEMEGLHRDYNRDSDKAHRLELTRARVEGDLKALRDRIWNTYELTYAGAEEFRQTEGFNVTEADRRAAQLSAEIRALGPVNVQAVEEYAETRTRYDDLMAQRKDMERAEADLRKLIAQLLDQMKTIFVEQFTQLQKYFSETFIRLFGGGHAELSLMDPSDPLNCGIEINAQPPGKKLQLLSLLSGGERTLTAIAILFATLKLKPTPFCILDEIEAALDDANIGYYADYLVEFSQSTQFVVVTHRKGTMERVNSLYGVSMEEQGVSKMVSVSLRDYEEPEAGNRADAPSVK